MNLNFQQTKYTIYYSAVFKCRLLCYIIISKKFYSLNHGSKNVAHGHIEFLLMLLKQNDHNLHTVDGYFNATTSHFSRYERGHLATRTKILTIYSFTEIVNYCFKIVCPLSFPYKI